MTKGKSQSKITKSRRKRALLPKANRCGSSLWKHQAKKNFRRFMLRGKEKVLIETGLLDLAHNIQKMAS